LFRWRRAPSEGFAFWPFCRLKDRPRLLFEAGLWGFPFAAAVFAGPGRDVFLLLGAFVFAGGLFLSVSVRKKRVAWYALSMWLVTIFTLVLFESTLRRTELEVRLRPREVGRNMVTDDMLFFVPPDFHMRFKGTNVRKMGFRSGPASVEKPEGTFRVICVGGSSTWGDGVESEDAWPSVLERMLRKRGLDADVINAGLPAYTTFQIFILLREYLVAYDPDVVVMYAGFNDMSLSVGPFTQREIWDMMQGKAGPWGNFVPRAQKVLSRSRLYGAMRLAIVGTKRRFERKMDVTTQRQEFLANVRDIHKTLSGREIPFLVMSEGTKYDDEVYHTGLANLAGREGFPFKDVYSELRRAETLKPIFSDVVHLTEEGNRAVAGFALELLEKSGALP